MSDPSEEATKHIKQLLLMFSNVAIREIKHATGRLVKALSRKVLKKRVNETKGESQNEGGGGKRKGGRLLN